jgi:hypothetical protein
VTVQTVHSSSHVPFVLAVVVAAGLSFYAGEKVGVRQATARMPASEPAACTGVLPASQLAAMPDGAATGGTETIGADCNTDYR